MPFIYGSVSPALPTHTPPLPTVIPTAPPIHPPTPPQVHQDPPSQPSGETQTQSPQMSQGPHISRRQAPRPRPVSIRADVHYNPATRILLALMELPGVKKQVGSWGKLEVVLSTCLINRVKQVTVQGRLNEPNFASLATSSSSSFSFLSSGGGVPFTSTSGGGVSVAALDSGSDIQQMTVRERRYGSFSRTFAVPADIKVRIILFLFFFFLPFFVRYPSIFPRSSPWPPGLNAFLPLIPNSPNTSKPNSKTVF